ncbi:hypothetical protein ACN6K5_002162 [Streptomyces violaceoruber]|uniref:hypothetical protein n=1 Tax=Streptomyces violaceoruber group TaxID=2867121 RepID=UPI0033FDF071
MSMDYCAIIGAAIAALIILLIAELLAGVRGNVESTKFLSERFAEPIKECVLAEHGTITLTEADKDRLKKQIDRYQKLHRLVARRLHWQAWFVAALLALVSALIIVLCWAASGKPADEGKIPENSNYALYTLVVTVASLLVLAIGYVARFKAAGELRKFQRSVERADAYGIADEAALNASYERWLRSLDEPTLRPTLPGNLHHALGLWSWPGGIRSSFRKYFE